MIDELTSGELETLGLLHASTQPAEVDPHHLAKLLAMALIEQKEGGLVLTALGGDRSSRARARQA